MEEGLLLRHLMLEVLLRCLLLLLRTAPLEDRLDGVLDVLRPLLLLLLPVSMRLLRLVRLLGGDRHARLTSGHHGGLGAGHRRLSGRHRGLSADHVRLGARLEEGVDYGLLLLELLELLKLLLLLLLLLVHHLGIQNVEPTVHIIRLTELRGGGTHTLIVL